MSKGYFIVGTDTGVGKTVVTGGLVGALRKRGINAVPYKPVQSGALPKDGDLIPPDVEFYKKVGPLPQEKYNTYALEPPLAPGLAAEICGINIDKEEILTDYFRLAEKYDLVIVEGAGGLYVPMGGTGFMLPGLIKAFDLPVIIVARAALGTINHTVLTVKCAHLEGLAVKGIIYNGRSLNEDLSQRTNPEIVEKITGVPAMGIIPLDAGIDVDAGRTGNVIELVEKHVNLDLLLEN